MNISFGAPLRAATLGVVCALAANTSASAATITVTTETGNAVESEFGFRADTGTRGSDLAGATVTATLSGGVVETRTYDVFTPFVSGGVNGSDWSLFTNQLGQTSLNAENGQIITNLVIDLSTSLSSTPATAMDAAVNNGAAIFDIAAANEDLGEAGSTDGTSFGFPFFFQPFNEPTGIVNALYSGAVSLTGQPAVGDLFTTLTLDFTGLDGGAFSGISVFEADTDVLLVPGDLNPVGVAAVPLPAGLPLLLAGLGGLGLLRRKRH